MAMSLPMAAVFQFLPKRPFEPAVSLLCSPRLFHNA
jgi:hypothetical protein